MKLLPNLPLFALFWQGAEALVPATQNVIRTSKSVPNRTPQFFTLLISKRASRHNSVHFFDMTTSKSAFEPLSFFFTLLTSKYASRHNGVHFFDMTTSKSVPNSSVFFSLLTSKCASCHNGEHFFDMTTSKSVPNPSVFFTFDFEMCFVPQRRALFQHENFQKWSDAEVFCTF